MMNHFSRDVETGRSKGCIQSQQDEVVEHQAATHDLLFLQSQNGTDSKELVKSVPLLEGIPIPISSKYLVRRCLEPLKAFSGGPNTDPHKVFGRQRFGKCVKIG